jgi:hypothetical protein
VILKQFYYKEFISDYNTWTLSGFYLNDKVNLLVGKNASGKTRSIYRISALARMIAGHSQLSLEIINSANFEAEFTDNQHSYIYSLATRNRNIASEIFSIDEEIKLDRSSDGTGKIYYETEKKPLDFNVTGNKLIVTSRRDSIQHPYLENLHKWAKGLRCYYFASSRDMGQKNMLATVDLEEFSNGDFNYYETSRINELFLQAKKEYGDSFVYKIIEFMREIGYDISDLTVDINPYTAVVEADRSPLYMLCVKEKDRNENLYQTGMSQGMFRALSLLIQLTYSIIKGISSTILIDDIGEGLDYDRCTKLIELLINLAEDEENNIQFIMSTNDRFVMNKIPFKYWQLIDRNGGECKIYNYKNAKEIFDEVKYTGLNNFDFLATDFINSEWNQK